MKSFSISFLFLALAIASGRSDATPVCGGASECQFEFNYTAAGNVASFGSGPYGTLTLDLLGNYNNSGKNAIKFTINLIGDDAGNDARLIDTGNGHIAFGFNYTGAGTLTLGNFSASIYSQNAGGSNSPFGTFTNGVTSSCSSGNLNSPCDKAVNVLTFIATNNLGFTNLDDVVHLTSDGGPDAYFSADIFHNGLTGSVGVTGPPDITITSTPEPQSAALLGTGLLGLGFLMKKLRRA